MKKLPYIAIFLFCITQTAAQADFLLFATETPRGHNIDPSNWGQVLQYRIDGSGGAVTQLQSIPNGQVFDPVSVEFRTPTQLYVGNRHGTPLGEGSISYFTVTETGIIYEDNITGMEAVCELSFNPVTGDLYVAAFLDGIHRITFTGDEPTYAGSVAGGGSVGLQVSPMGDRLFATFYGNQIYQFHIEPDGELVPLSSISVPGAMDVHNFGMHPSGEMYLADYGSHGIHRFVFDNDGHAVYNGYVDASMVDSVLDVAFSPDGQEMFISEHQYSEDCGIYRFLHEAETDTWAYAGLISTSSLAGIAVTTIPKAVKVAIDIKPQSCPNPLNLKSKGLLPVAILGTEDFDVNTIDIVSIRLQGVAPIRSSFEDVETPVLDGNDCDCNVVGPDGYLDLNIKFETEEIVGALGDVNDGDVVPLTLTGVLHEEHCETPIQGSDCIVVLGKVPRSVKVKKSDVNEDGVIDLQDFCMMAEYWLEASAAQD